MAYPEYQYRIKNANGIWMASRTEPTQNNIASFAFFAAGTDFYKIYSIDKGQWVSYDKSNGSDNCKDFVKFANSQDAANAWKITTTTRSNQKVYQIQPQNNDGSVSNRYMNWNAGVGDGGGYGYSYDDTKTVGLWRDNGSADGGSAWILVDNTESVSEVADFENGAIYTFVTARGWMGANTTANVISSAYGGNNIPAADVKRTNPNFQWTVYKSANNKYYLYNIGKGQFMGMQTANNAAIPFAETPAGLKMTFKKSGNANYPIMFSIDNVGVVNHSTDRSYGLIYWNGGWSNPNDEGSNHKVVKVGELDDATLSAIQARVAQYEETAILKMPEAGKYYRIKAVAEWNDDAPYLGSKNSAATSGRAEFIANADAYSIFYFDGDYLKSYATGNYLVSNSGFLGYNGMQATGSKIGFKEDTYVAGVYNISFNDGGRWLYVHQSNYTDAGSSAGNVAGYRFNIVEVTELPVAQIGNTVYYTIAEAVTAVKAGETLTLFVNTDETFVLPLGAVLDKNGHTADNVTVAQPVAKIGEQGYASLSAAITAATAGQTVTLIGDAEESKTLVIGKSLTIDGAGKTFTGAIEFNKNRGSYTIKNVKFNGAGTRTYALKTTSTTDKLTVEGCTATGYTYGFLHANKTATDVIVKNVTVNDVNYGVHSVYGTNVTLEYYKAINTANAVYVQNHGTRNVVLDNCTFESCEKPLGVWERNQTNKITFNFKGVNEMGKAEFCTSLMAKIVADAKIGATVYETLEAAVAAAQSGETVTLLSDVTLAASAANGAFEIAAGKKLTLNLNGKNITASAREGYTGRTQYAFDNRADLTITGAGTITSRGIQNYGTLTINSADVKLVACDADGGACVWGYENSVTNIAAGTFENIAGNSGLVNTAGKLNVTGGTFTQKGQGATYAIICKGAEATFENATIAGVHGVIAAEGNAKVTINSGDYTLLGVTGQSDHCVYAAGNASVAIMGGTFKSNDHDAGGKTLYLDGETASFAVSGGVFDEVVAENLCAEGFVPATEQNADGTYGVEEEVSGHVAYRADVTDKEEREGIAILLKDVLAKKSLVVKVYNGETLMFTCTRRDIDDEGKVMFPVNHANTTANIVLWGKESGSWINKIHVAPTVFNVPNKVEIYADGKLTESYTHESGTILGTNLEKYLALECVKKAVAKVGETQYLTLKEAIAGATAGQTITFLGDITENVTITKNLTIDGAGKVYTGKMTAQKEKSLNVKNLNFVNGGFSKEKSTKGTYTFTNCTFDGQGTYAYPIHITGANTVKVENCTVKDYLYSFLYVPNAVTTITVKEVAVENLPSYAVMFNSSVTNATFENFTVKKSPVGFYVANTAAQKLTLNNCKMEEVETVIQHRSGTSTITCTALGVNELGTTNISEYVKFNAGAQAGTTVYEDATAAIAAVKAGDVLTLFSDVTLDQSINVTGNLTINGNGKTLTYTGSDRAITVENTAKDVNLTVNNLTVDCTSSNCQRGINYNTNGALTLEGVTVKGTNVTYALNLPGSSDNATVVINNSSLTGNIALNVWGENATITATNTVFTSVDNAAAEGYAAVKLNNDGETAAEGTEINIIGGKIDVTGDACGDTEAVCNATSTGTINIDESTTVNGEVATMVAVIRYADGTSYSFKTLAEAVEFAKAGETVTLLRDITVANPVTIAKSITLDGANKTLTYTGSDRAIEMPNDAEKALEVTIKNLNVAFSGSYCQRGINYNDNGKLTLENVTVNAGATYALNLPGSSDGATVTINKSSLTGNIALNVWGENVKVDATDSHFTSVDNATHEGYSAIALNNDGSTVANGTIVNINGGTITAKDENGNDSNAVRNSTANGKVNVSTTTAVVGSIVNPVAIVDYGTDQFYSCATLQAAIDKAIATNGTVKLIADATGAGAVINGFVTIDFAGHTYSFNEGVGSTGTPSNGLQILKGNTVVLKNGTLNVAADAADKFYILVQNYANLTVEDMTLDGTNLDKWSKVETDQDSYVLSNNSGTVNVIASTIIANNDGEKAFALDACKKDSYEAPVVNVDAESTIDGNAEVSATLNFAGTLNGTIVINEKTGVVTGATGLNVTTTVENTKVVYADGKYTLVAAVAKIGETAFASLAEAITAAKAGETITLVADITENVTITKSLTIDGASKQYTGTMTGNDNLTVTVKNVAFVNGGFVKDVKTSKGIYTFTDCTFNGQGTYAYPISIKGANKINVENCTVNNYLYGFLYLRSAANNVYVNNVTVEDCPNYAIYFASGAGNVLLENVAVKNAASGVVYNNTASRAITMKNCVMENVNTAVKYSSGTSTITCTFEGVNDLGTATFSEYVKVNAAAQTGAIYGDFAGVLEKVSEGATVTILNDLTLTTADYVAQNDGYAVLVNAEKTMTIDLNGKKVTVNAAAADLAGAKGKMLLAVFHAEPGAHLTLTDNSAEGTANVTVNVNDANVYSVFSTESAQGKTSGNLTVNGGSYTTVGNLSNAMIFTDTDDAIVINDGNFYCDGVSTTNVYPWMVNTLGNNEISVVVTGGTFNVDINHQYRPFEVFVPETLAVKANDNSAWTIVPAQAYVTEMLGAYVNEPGSREHKVGYATLPEAVAGVNDLGNEITLLANATGAGVVINKDVTIDFNEKTYTVNKAVGSKGTETLGMQILKGNDVTLKNGTLTSTAVVEGKEVKMLINNYANLTLEDMNLVDETDHILYALSNNSGDVKLLGNTNITTDAVAFDACKFGSYDAPTVIVETEGKITGAIEKNDGATIAISGGTFTAEILPEWCAEYYAPIQIQNADGTYTYTVEYRYIDELTIEHGQEFANDTEKTIGTLTYTRTFGRANKWQPLFVPFETPVEVLNDLGYEVAYLYDVHNVELDNGEVDPTAIESVHFVKITKGTLRANHPYIIKPTSDAALNLVLELSDVKLHSTATDKLISVESSTTTTRFIFAGTYKKANRATLTGDDNIPCYAMIASSTHSKYGEFAKMGATATVTPFSIFMYIVNKDGSPVILNDEGAQAIKIRIVGEENEDGITFIDNVENNIQDVNFIYDLQGRRVLEPKKGGIYIINGKKVYYNK